MEISGYAAAADSLKVTGQNVITSVYLFSLVFIARYRDASTAETENIFTANTLAARRFQMSAGSKFTRERLLSSSFPRSVAIEHANAAVLFGDPAVSKPAESCVRFVRRFAKREIEHTRQSYRTGTATSKSTLHSVESTNGCGAVSSKPNNL